MLIEFFRINKYDTSVKSDRNKMQFLRIIAVQNLKVGGDFIFPILVGLCGLLQIINTYDSKE